MMAARSFLGLDAFSDRQIHKESPTIERRLTTENEQKVQKSSGGGTEHSDGKTWFRGRMIGGGQGSVYLADPIIFGGFLSQMAVKSAPMPHSSSIQSEKRALSVLNGGPNLVRFYRLTSC